MAFYEVMKQLIDGEVKFPGFIQSCAFHDPDDNTYVTYIPDDRDYWIPDTLTELSEQEVKDRTLDIHSRYPYKNKDGSDKTTEEVNAFSQSIIDYNKS